MMYVCVARKIDDNLQVLKLCEKKIKRVAQICSLKIDNSRFWTSFFSRV